MTLWLCAYATLKRLLVKMRFLFYDRVESIERGKSVKGIKSFALSEEFPDRDYGADARMAHHVFP
jgi:hypothetical protein